jgi:hypothetical protein
MIRLGFGLGGLPLDFTPDDARSSRMTALSNRLSTMISLVAYIRLTGV